MNVNDKKICFISCVNNDEYEHELIKYISRLKVPEGYETEYLGIREAGSMCAGYNEGMQASDAKYKVYLHQDTFIVDENFLFYLIDIFSDSTIGMFGLVGSPMLPEDCIMWDGPRVGQVYYSTYYRAGINYPGPVSDKVQDVECVDGFLIATGVDIPWREDLFKYWDFYDISQGFEMRRAGFRVVVPNQGQTPWCMHDDGFMNLGNYEIGRRNFAREYRNSDIPEDADTAKDTQNKKELIANKSNQINELLEAHNNEAYTQISQLIHNDSWFTPVREVDEFAALYLAMNIYEDEMSKDKKENVLCGINSLSELKQKLFGLRMSLYDIRFGNPDNFIELWEDYPSLSFYWRGIFNMTPDAVLTAYRIYKIFKANGNGREALLILMQMNAQWPDKTGVLILLADELSKVDAQLAAQYLQQVPQTFWALSQEEQAAIIDLENEYESINN